MNDFDMTEIIQVFFAECDEGCADVETCLQTLRDGAGDDETINTIFRGVHSIKGGAGAFGYSRLQKFTHEYESVLDFLRGGVLSLTPSILDLIVTAFDVMTDHVAAARGERAAPDDTAILERLRVVGNNPQEACVETSVDFPMPAAFQFSEFEDEFSAPAAMLDLQYVWFTPQADATWNGAEPLLLLREAVRLGATIVEIDTFHLPALEDFDPSANYLRWKIALPQNLDRNEFDAIFDFCAVGTIVAVDDVTEDAALPATAAAHENGGTAPTMPGTSLAKSFGKIPDGAHPVRSSTPVQPQAIRVDLDKLDRMVNLVGELVITQTMLVQWLGQKGMDCPREVADLESLTRELQEATMAIRAQPMKAVFNRMPRIVRELESETGKRVALVTAGEMTEVDKTIVEKIGEPLTHLIRNAVDHGLETPAERLASEKSEEGTIRVSAAHRSGRIIITIADDGRGINRRKVREKAIERGLISETAILSDEETDNLIFRPGFSTADTVSSISGRGVGMDVVLRNIQALGGWIAIRSEEGRGSTFTLSLPLTLSILDGMIVMGGGETYVIPLGSIVESLRPEMQMIRKLSPDGPALLDVRGTYVPVYSLARRLNPLVPEADPTQSVLIVVESTRGMTALLVDSIREQRQIVVKSLETNYQSVPGVAGATILGDGRVALIIDVENIVTTRLPTASARLPVPV